MGFYCTHWKVPYWKCHMYPADKIHQLKNTVGIKWRSSNKQFIQDTPYRPKEKDKNQENYG